MLITWIRLISLLDLPGSHVTMRITMDLVFSIRHLGIREVVGVLYQDVSEGKIPTD